MIDPEATARRTSSTRTQTEDSLLRERLLATLSSFFGGLALLLACLGLYGLMAYAVARRTAEIGIRMALGAPREQIVWLVLRGTLSLVTAGILLGVPLSLWAARYANALLFGVGSADPVVLAISIAALMAVTALAAYLPARRASRVDPVVALRYE
jgi:ABC-type antimicrobial peptide transport system permease subunit